MTLHELEGLWTIVVLITFAGIVWWAYGGRRKQRFEQDAHIPFDEEPPRRSDDHG